MNNRPDDIIKSCRRLESGLRLGPEGVRACQLGAFASPIYWSADEISRLKITKEMIVEKRKWLLGMLNDEISDISCKICHMVTIKRYGDVNLTRLGQIDLASTSRCNLRCSFCGFVKEKMPIVTLPNDLEILKVFKPDDIEWDAVVDFNGGEPTLLKNLDEYFDYFASRRIRIRFMTNGVKFQPSVFDGLKNGAIQWVVTSLDAGTPSTYLRLKQRDFFLQVIETLTRYASAGSKGGGRLAIKYIFCGENCLDDDISGFTYAMLAIRPHQVWLTFDFSVIGGDSPEFGDYDFSKDIAAYARMYGLMKKHGITPVHYSTGHLAAVCQKGKHLLDRVKYEIEKTTFENTPSELILKDFRQSEKINSISAVPFNIKPLRIITSNQTAEPWSLKDQKVLLTPGCVMAITLLLNAEIKESQILGFLDRDPVVQGKFIEGLPIYGYEGISDLSPDVILIASPEQHRGDIIQQLSPYLNKIKQIAIYIPSL